MYSKLTNLEISNKVAADLVRETNVVRILAEVGTQTTQPRDQQQPGVLWNGDRIVWHNGWVLVPHIKLAAAAIEPMQV